MRDSERAGLAILRIGLGVFLALWGIDKIVVPDATVQIFDSFYKIPISTAIAPAIGIAEVLLGLAIALGVWKTVTYGLGLLVHGVSTIASYRQLLDPFGDNHLFLAAIPVLAGYAALYLLRRQDTMWALGGARATPRTAEV
jgi:putative oxidoreductase